MQRTALVLQGGAALGAFEVGVVQRLYRDSDFQPDLIAGVSMGAITGAILCASRDDPLQTLTEFWNHLAKYSAPLMPAPWDRLVSLLGVPRFFRPRIDFWNVPFWSSFYDMTPLKRLLESLIAFDELGKQGPQLLVAVTNIERGHVQYFDSRHDVITPDHLLASGALPPAFPTTRIGSFHYWDGGLVDHRPLGPIIERLGPEPEIEKRIVAVELQQERGWVPQNLLEVYDRIFELIFLERFGFDHRQTEKRNELAELYQAMDKELPPDSPLRRLPGFKRLAKYRMIQRLDFIRNRDAAVVRGPFDFSPKAVSRRIHAGYEDADFHLAKSDRTATDASTDQSLESSCSSRPSPKS